MTNRYSTKAQLLTGLVDEARAATDAASRFCPIDPAELYTLLKTDRPAARIALAQLHPAQLPRLASVFASYCGELTNRLYMDSDVLAFLQREIAQADPIAAALDEILTDIRNVITALPSEQGNPDAKTERTYWQAQERAFTKAQHQHLMGLVLTRSAGGYNVPSVSRPGALVHRITKLGGVWNCGCEAGTNARFCWHSALVQAYERAGELAALPDTCPCDAVASVPARRAA